MLDIISGYGKTQLICTIYEQSDFKERMNKIVVVTGISGGGKDYILNKVCERRPDIKEKMPIFSFGSELYKKLKEKGVDGDLKSRDELKNLTDQLQIKNAIIEIIAYILARQPAIINTHLAYKQNGSIQINPDIARRIRPRDYIFIRTDPKLLQERRIKDKNRSRDDEDLVDINLHQEIALSTALIVARAVGSRVTVVENNDDNIDDNINFVAQILEGF